MWSQNLFLLLHKPGVDGFTIGGGVSMSVTFAGRKMRNSVLVEQTYHYPL